MTCSSVRMVWLVALAAVIPAAAEGQAADEPPRARRLDGSSRPAELRDLDTAWRPTFAEPAGTQHWREGELFAWGTWRDAGRGGAVVLRAGSVLAGDVTMLDDARLVVESPVFSTLELRRENVRGIVWRPPADAVERDRLLLRLAEEPRREDRLWLANGDERSGKAVPPEDAAAPIGGLAEVRFVPAGSQQPLGVAIENVVALGFAAALERPAPPVGAYALLGLRDGGWVWATRFERAGPQCRVTLLDGETLLAHGDTLLRAITSIQMFGPHVTYLSDLTPLGYKHVPFLSMPWDYRLDRNLSGGLLRTAGRVFPKGIAMHSTSRLAWQIDRRFRRLECDLGMDESVGARGSVVFRVYVERTANDAPSPVWQVAYESPIVRGGDVPISIAVDVANAQRLALVVEFADRGDEGDRAQWLNARLIP